MAILTGFLRRCLAAGLAVLAGSGTAGATGAAQGDAGARAVKAAFLYNFTKFIEWPDGAFTGTSAPFNVCVVADEQFVGEVTATMRNEQVQGRRVEVSVPAESDDLKTCHLVYFSQKAGERAGSRLASVRQLPVLTIGEGPRFLQDGGMIAFTVVDNRVRFDINRRAADGAKLAVSSKLLRVARIVDGAPTP